MTGETLDELRERAGRRELILEDAVRMLDEGDHFAVGSLCGWIFIGSLKEWWDDFAFLEDIYRKKYSGSRLRKRKVLDIRIRSWDDDGEPDVILFKISGNEEGPLTFMADYPAMIEYLREKKAPAINLAFTRDHKIVTSYAGRKTRIIPGTAVIRRLRRDPEVCDRWPSMRAAAEDTRLDLRKIRNYISGRRSDPEYYWEQEEK